MSKQAENLLDTEPSALQDWLTAKNLRISNYPTHRATSLAISHQDQILSREAFASNIGLGFIVLQQSTDARLVPSGREAGVFLHLAHSHIERSPGRREHQDGAGRPQKAPSMISTEERPLE